MKAPPTAENIVGELATVTRKLLEGTEVQVARIRLWETPNGSAEWFAPAFASGLGVGATASSRTNEPVAPARAPQRQP